MTTKNEMTNTRAAFVLFCESEAARVKLWENAQNSDDVKKAELEDKTALDSVRMAFYEDTKEYNSLDDCMNLPPNYLMRFKGA